MNELERLLDQILLAVASGKHRPKTPKLTAFFPVKGNLATGELMVVGRAVNGWGDGWQPTEASDADKRKEIVTKVSAPVWAANCCPMSWVQKSWHATGFNCQECGEIHSAAATSCLRCEKDAVRKAYNTAKSAFWRVMRSTTDKLGVADTTNPEWPSHLIWSDLYKVAPAAGGNPSSGQIGIQHDLCVQMLKEEIRQWKPRRIVFLTGLDWAEPFFSGIGVTEGNRLNGLVSYSGKIKSAEGTTSFVVAPHPQGKPEAQIVSEIDFAFAGLAA